MKRDVSFHVYQHLNFFPLIIMTIFRPQEIDEAARRRFVKRLYIPLPEFDARCTIICNLLKQQNFQLTEDQLRTICSRTDGKTLYQHTVACTVQSVYTVVHSLGYHCPALELMHAYKWSCLFSVYLRWQSCSNTCMYTCAKILQWHSSETNLCHYNQIWTKFSKIDVVKRTFSLSVVV